MIISLIVAMDEERGIGLEGDLPWRLSQDLKHFKRVTMGHHLLMGRKTFLSIGGPLPGRTMIVLSRNPDFQAKGCLVVHSLDRALEVAGSRGETEIFVIGGESVFRQALPLADRLYMTRVHTRVEADTYFPAFDPTSWELVSETHYEEDRKNEYPFTIKTYHRRNGRGGGEEAIEDGDTGR